MADTIQSDRSPASNAADFRHILAQRKEREMASKTHDAKVAIVEIAPVILKVFESDILHYKAKNNFGHSGVFSDDVVDSLRTDLDLDPQNQPTDHDFAENYKILDKGISNLTKLEQNSLFGACVRGGKETESLRPEIEKIVADMKKICDKNGIKYEPEALESYVVLITKDSLNKNISRNRREELGDDFSMLNVRTFYETLNQLADKDRVNDINAIAQLRKMILPEGTVMSTEHNGERYNEIMRQIDDFVKGAEDSSFVEKKAPFVTSNATADFANHAKKLILQKRESVEFHPREGVTDYKPRGADVIEGTIEPKIRLDGESGMKLAEKLLSLAQTFRQKGDEGHVNPVNVQAQENAIKSLARLSKD